LPGHPPGSSRAKTQVPRFRCQLTYLSTPQQRTPTRVARASASETSSWSPPDAITPRLLPGRSPRRSSANAAPKRFSACPRRPTLEGQQASISCTAPPILGVFYTAPPSAFVTHELQEIVSCCHQPPLRLRGGPASSHEPIDTPVVFDLAEDRL